MDVLEKIERGEIGISVHIGTWDDDMRDINGQLRKRAEITAELLKLAKIGQRMRWIPVSERLPEIIDMVDIIYKHDGNQYRVINVIFDVFEQFGMYKNVLYWRPSENDRPGEG